MATYSTVTSEDSAATFVLSLQVATKLWQILDRKEQVQWMVVRYCGKLWALRVRNPCMCPQIIIDKITVTPNQA